ncbi:endonuclease V [Flavobacterium salilacus subsp. salilacus]|uniref:deoxyribonuclease V n=1 Tax=Flavobacterium TaxID=237 RepID=UPI001074DB2D|nr:MULTISPECIES: deoxyribonuclease V [Flavobacterium]KAF2519317.1 endonuclease V [Flavobacterium salilacus subsp. salilacus]MBE1613508.1 endonuclease V [Flavobacterium sp. SaA2.13]
MLNYDGISIAEATAMQNEMRNRIVLKSDDTPITTIAGADISHNKYSDTVYAGIVVLRFPEMVVQSYSLIAAETKFPYISGYLAFREVPALLQAWEQLPQKPDVVVLDGQGITHPRRMGIACHFGLLADCAAIGCAKNMLFGNYPELSPKKFSNSSIYINNDVVGYALRTKDTVKPVFISPGHKISVEDSLTVMTQCIGKHRIPEPTRMAHEKVNLFRTGKLTSGYHVADIQGSLF